LSFSPSLPATPEECNPRNSTPPNRLSLLGSSAPTLTFLSLSLSLPLPPLNPNLLPC